MGKTAKYLIAAAGVLALAAAASQAAFLLGHPYFVKYARQNGVSLSEARDTWGKPSPETEWLMGLSVEAFEENWEKVSSLAAEDRTSEIGTYYYNLANAMTGSLPDRLLDYYQPFERGLFLTVDDTASPFQITCSGDVWFHLGEMTMAEHSAILGMIFSPEHRGPRYLERMAEINLVTCETASAQKYLDILAAGSAPERRWARAHSADGMTVDVRRRLNALRDLQPSFDVVHGATQTQLALRILLASNSSNRMALDYLLCYDLLTKDLDSFIRDYAPSLTSSHLYDEAVMLFLYRNNGLSQENVEHYGIGAETAEKFSRFMEVLSRDGGSGRNLPAELKKSYWYYFHFAVKNEK